MLTPYNKRAQTTFEYSVLITIVVAAIITMHTYMCRSVQGRLKGVEVDLNREAQR